MHYQVANVEQAKKLNQLLNVPQWKNIDFNFYWMKTEATDNFFLTEAAKVGGYAYPVEYFPTFTVAELGVMLPEEINHKHNEHSSYYFMQGHGINGETEKNEPVCWYEDNDLETSLEVMNMKYCGAKNEAQARADMLIFLLENKLITPEEVNKRLAS